MPNSDPATARTRALALLAAGLLPVTAAAHHGVAGLGAAGLQGPGAPIEMATSATLPAGGVLAYLKLDHARFERYTPEADGEGDYSQFWMAGLGYGFTSWFSGYVFLPYHTKVDEPGGFDTRGYADMSVFGQLGFAWDDGLRLIPPNESLDDLEDWHFTVFGGASLPTGNPDLRAPDGSIDPGKSTGFGEPSWTLGLTATTMLAPRWTLNFELSGIWFQEHEYADGNRTRFGTEQRANAGLVYRAYTDLERKLRLDLALEAQFLRLGRDRTNGEGEPATGGDIYYLLPGVRFYYDRYSVAFGVKTPVATNLNEEEDQQGAEGKEDYRLIVSVSALF